MKVAVIGQFFDLLTPRFEYKYSRGGQPILATKLPNEKKEEHTFHILCPSEQRRIVEGVQNYHTLHAEW